MSVTTMQRISSATPALTLMRADRSQACIPAHRTLKHLHRDVGGQMITPSLSDPVDPHCARPAESVNRAMKNSAGNKPARRLHDLRDVADVLNCSVDSVDRMLRRGVLPFVRFPSGRRRVRPEDLDAAIENWKVEKA